MNLDFLHDRLYDILQVIDEVCRRNRITYWLHGGSAIGAVREHDFIPWDDDLDILIFAEDYERFKTVMQRDLPEYLVLIEPEDFSPLFFDFVPRIQDSRWLLNTENEESKAYNNLNNRIGIDVFLLSRIPKNKYLMNMWLFHYNVLYGMAMKYRFHTDYSKYSIIQKGEVFVLGVMGTVISGNDPKKILKLWRTLLQSNYASDSGIRMVANTTPQCYWRPMPENWFSETVYMAFRDMRVPVEKEYDKILRQAYGDYRKPDRDENRYIVHLRN